MTPDLLWEIVDAPDIEAPNSLWMPDTTTPAIWENARRTNMDQGTFVPASGTLYVIGGCVIPQGETVDSISVWGGTALVGPANNLWFCLVDRATLSPLGFTVDEGAGAVWGGNVLKTLAMNPPYRETQTNRPIWVGVLENTATPAGLVGSPARVSFNNIAPQLSMAADAGLTNPASCPDPITLAAGQIVVPYCTINRAP